MNKIIMVFSIVILSTIGCKDKEGTSPNGGGNGSGYSDAQKAQLYDKVWYPQGAAGGVELEFLSNGTFRQALSLPGTYSWQNNGDTMNINAYGGTRFNYIFDKITDTEFTYRSNFGGDNYNTPHTFATTKK